MRRVLTLVLVICAVGAAASAATAGTSTAYKAQVNAICRAYTPRLRAVEADMSRAHAAGDIHRYAYDVGVVMGASLSEGLKVEATPVPASLKPAMRAPLRLLHRVDAALRTSLQRAVAGDPAGFTAGLAALKNVGPGLNAAFDSVGLRDCGSAQT